MTISFESLNSESFQNLVLRKSIKSKHTIIILHFVQYLKQKKILFNQLNREQKSVCIVEALKNDGSLKLEYRGMMVGGFTIEDYLYYLQDKKEVNKRINWIITKRLVDSISEISTYFE